MTWNPDAVRLAIARDLREVEQLACDLHTQALNTPNDRDFPGGTALNMLARGATPQDWEALYEQIEAAERWDKDGKDRWRILTNKGKITSNKLDPAVYQGNDDEQPLNVLCFWTRVIREELDQPTSLTPTISREVAYLSSNVVWMTRADEFGEPEWMEVFELAKDVKTLRRLMEDALRAGSRIDIDTARCWAEPNGLGNGKCGGSLARVSHDPKRCAHAQYAASTGRNLAQVLATSPALTEDHKNCDQGGRDDIYRCLSCEKRYTPAEYWLAVREGMEEATG